MTGLRFEVVQVRLEELDAVAIREWRALEHRALEANAYLSPDFVLPATRHLRGDADPVPLFVYAHDGISRQLVGVGVFEERGPSRRFPLRHLCAYRSLHSFLTGLLVDRNHAERALDAFFDYFLDAGSGWHGVEFVERTADTELDRLLQAAAARKGLHWQEFHRCSRAVLVPAEAGESGLEAVLPRSRRRDCDRLRRRLAEQGDLAWHLKRGRDVDAECIERLVQLEHLGWKGEEGTSLRARHGHDVFFRDMMGRFASDGRAFFTELQLNGRVIATSGNLESGGAGFAFKIGWDPGYRRSAPGLLNELEFVRAAPIRCSDLSYIDSGAEEGSFIDELWPGRRQLVSGVFITTTLGRALAAVFGRVRHARRRIRRRP